MKRVLCRLVAISLSLPVVASNAQTLAPFSAPAVTNVPAVLRAEPALPFPEPVQEAQIREAEAATANLLAASSNAVGLVQSAQRISGVPGGGRAEFGLLKAYFPADAAGGERFRVTTPDSRTLAFQPRFLAWYDTSTGERWLLAQVTNRVGLIVPSGQVLYTNAFDSIHADLRYRYGRFRLEQDVVIRERLPLPEGALADNLRLEIWTEWFDSTPASREPRMIDLRKGTAMDGAAPTLAADEQADFISAKIGDGYAFSTGEPDIRIPVSKTWARVDQRDWLIETVDYTALKVKLDALSGAGGKRTAKAGSSQEELIRALASRGANGTPVSDPASSLIETAQRARPEANAPSLLLALADLPEIPGVVVDFAILACVPVPAGVVSWWPAGGNAQDVISANHGTLHNSASFTAGKVGQGFNLPAYDEYSQTGGDGFVRVPDATNLRLTSALTIEAWIYPTAIGGYGSIVAKWGAVAGYNERAYVLALYPDGRCYLLVSPNGTDVGATYVLTANAVPLDEWTHVVGTYDGSALRVYFNGELEAEGAYSAGIHPGTHELGIGAVIGGAPAGYGISLFSGAIDEAGIYDRALSATEIGMIYEAGAAGKINPNCVAEPSDLAAWLPGDTHAYDVHTGNAATLQNGAGYAPAVASHGFMFDGVNDGVTMTDANAAALNFAAGQDFSVEVWLKADVHSPTYGVASVLGKRYSPNSYTALGWELFLINGQPGLQLADSSGPANYIAPGNLRNTGWRHVVVTVDRDSTTGVRFYVDGVQLTQFNPTGKAGSLSSTAPLRIGVHPQPGLNCFYKGVIDEATVYQRALDATEVSALFQAGSAGKCKADVDSDGMEDWWEMRYFGNLTRNGTGDFDNDGLTDLEEFQFRTDPTLVELQASAYKSPCEDKVYVDVTNLSGKKIKGGSFDLFVYLTAGEMTHYSVLQPWGPTDELPPGESRTFTFCTPDEWIADFDCRMIHQGASGGSASQKFRVSIREELARIFKNTTQISHPCEECDNCYLFENPPPLITPQPRPVWDTMLGQSPCAPWPCDEWPDPLPTSAGGGSQLLDNFYKPSDPPEHIDLSCPKKGFKNVYAIKQWHGRWGFNSREGSDWDRITEFVKWGDCFAAAPKNTPDTTKYLTLQATATYSHHAQATCRYSGAEYSESATVTRTSSIHPHSGRDTRAETRSGSNAWSIENARGMLAWASGGPGQILNEYLDWVDYWAAFGDVVYTGGGGAWTANIDAGDFLVTVSVDLGAGTFSYVEISSSEVSDWNGEECVPGARVVQNEYRETLTLSATEFHWEATFSGEGSTEIITETTSRVDAYLSSPYTSDQVNSDVDELLASWNLLDDTEYPWRTDAGTSRGPLVTRNELGSTPPSIDFNLVNVGTPEEPNWQPEPDNSTMPWPSQAPGAILGAPLPVHVNGELRTYEAYFNFYHPNWHFEDSDVGFPEAFLKSRGAFSPYPNATQWVDDNMARVLPGGPFWGYGSARGDDKFTFWFKNPYLTDTDGEWEHGGIGASLIKCKWAETIDESDPEHGKDFVFKDWKFNFRDFAESYHACIQNYYMGTLGCPSPGGCNPVRFTPIAENYPMGNIVGNGSYWLSDMTTTPLEYDYHCCRPVVLVQPTPPPGPDCNGLFVQMPPAVCDERYGSLWMGRVDQSTSDVNSCPNYVANRNAGIANPPDCDPQIELSLTWHQFYDPMRNEHWGRYEIFVAPLVSAMAAIRYRSWTWTLIRITMAPSATVRRRMRWRTIHLASSRRSTTETPTVTASPVSPIGMSRTTISHR